MAVKLAECASLVKFFYENKEILQRYFESLFDFKIYTKDHFCQKLPEK